MEHVAQLRFPGAAGHSRQRRRNSKVPWRLVVCVLLPFAAGFHLSYLLRTINALIAGQLASDIGIGPAELGLLTSAYFLAFGAAQIPCGILLDRHGPKLVQSILLLIASVGALVFAIADSPVLLVIGRALIGLGVAAGLMAGLKAVVMWFPAERQALANGWMMMVGTLGAVTATAPADFMIDSIGWRGLFAVMGGLCALVALLVLVLAPDQRPSRAPPRSGPTITVWTIYGDARFWRIAPLSALGIGTSWALQGLWAAPWLRDVDGLDRAAVVSHLGIMAIVLSVSGLMLGLAADRLRRSGIRTELLLAGTFALSLVAQVALVLDWPVPAVVSWSLIAAAGVATVLGYTVLGELFPRHASGRANGALNLLQVGAAFAVQSVFGAIVALWEPNAGHYPPEAYRTALVLFIGLQLVALGWFATAVTEASAKRHSEQRRQATTQDGVRPAMSDPYRAATIRWTQQIRQARTQIALWRSTAAASFMLLALLGSSVGALVLSDRLRADREYPGRSAPHEAAVRAAAIAASLRVTLIRDRPHHAGDHHGIGDVLLFRERESHAYPE
jgi:MFS family permease